MSNLYSFAIGVGSKNSRGEWLEVFYPAPLLNPEQGAQRYCEQLASA